MLSLNLINTLIFHWHPALLNPLGPASAGLGSSCELSGPVDRSQKRLGEKRGKVVQGRLGGVCLEKTKEGVCKREEHDLSGCDLFHVDFIECDFIECDFILFY